MKKTIIKKIIPIFIFAFSLELSSWIILRAKLIPDVTLLAGMSKLKHYKYQGQSWRNEKESWGGWHLKNATSRHVKSCFDVTYNSNAYGARDEEFQIIDESKSRIILLGDSFAEGYGVKKDKTAANILENINKNEVYNFGSALNNGPLQYYLLYKELASKFEHDKVLIFLTEGNDFSDNDINANKWKRSNFSLIEKRYRPYFIKNKDESFSYFYPKKAIKREKTVDLNSPKTIIKRYLYYSNLYKIAFFIKNFSYDHTDQKLSNTSIRKSSQRPQIQQEATVYFIKKIIEASKGKTNKVILFSIPDSRSASTKDSYWYSSLKKISESDPHFLFIDGFLHLPNDPKDQKELLLTCDGHWSEKGNKWAAETVNKYLNFN